MDFETLNEIGLRADALPPDSQARADINALLERVFELEDERAAAQRRATDLRRQVESAVAAAFRSITTAHRHTSVQHSVIGACVLYNCSHWLRRPS